MFASPLYLARGYFRRRRTLFAALTLIFAAGMLLGAVASSRTDPGLHGDLSERMENAWAGTARAAAGPVPWISSVRAAWLEPGGIAYFIGAQAVLALSFVGAPLALLFLFWRGFSLGFAAAWTVHLYSWRGAAVATALLGPGHVFRIPALLVATAATLDVCWAGWRLLWGGRGSLQRPAVRAAILWIVGAALLTAGALAESFFSPAMAAWTAEWLLKE